MHLQTWAKIMFLPKSLKMATDDPTDSFTFLDESLLKFVEKISNKWCFKGKFFGLIYQANEPN